MRSTPMIPVPTAAGPLATQGMIAAANPFVDQQGILTPIAYRFLYSTFRTSVGPAGPQGPVGPPGPVSPTSLVGDVTGSGSGTVPTTLSPSGVTAGTYVGLTIDAKGRVTAAATPPVLLTQGYTVATLPAAPGAGARAYVTDATAPTFLGALTGGGTVRCPVFYNGTAWVAG